MCRHKGSGDGLGKRTGTVLFRQVQAGCRDCLDELMKEHDGLVHAVVRKQVLGALPYDEAIQAGRIGLWRAILGYDPDRGTAFSTYAWPSIARHVWQAVREAERSLSPCVRESAEPSVSTWDPALVLEARALSDALHELVQRQAPRLRYIIAARYGLDGGPPLFYRQIGQRLHLSGERIRQLHQEALLWLRHPAHSQQVRSLLARHTVSDYEWAEAQVQQWRRKRGGRHG